MRGIQANLIEGTFLYDEITLNTQRNRICQEEPETFLTEKKTIKNYHELSQ